MLSLAHKNQLRQLKKLDRPAYSRAKQLLGWSKVYQARRVIVEAMLRALKKQNQPWQLIKQAIRSQNIPTASKKQVKLTKQVSLRYRNDGYIVLYGFYTQSQPIILWKNDTSVVSSPSVGKWKLTSEAQINFEKWQQEVNLV